jgi:hypothetical protein
MDRVDDFKLTPSGSNSGSFKVLGAQVEVEVLAHTWKLS